MIERPSQLAAGAGFCLGASLGLGATAQAATFTVTTVTDDGSGTTLREAVAAANNNNSPTVDRILFQTGLSGTITLNGTQLPLIDEPLSVVGLGARSLTVSGDRASRIFNIDTDPGANVTISGLTLTAGRTTGLGTTGRGGAISSFDADLTIRAAVISGSETTGSVAGGGGLASVSGTTRIESSTISGNSTEGGTSGGGGLYLYANPSTIESSTISGNRTEGSVSDGGGVYMAGMLTIEGSTISGNSAGAPNADGGGVLAFSGTSGPRLINTIVANNSAGGDGPDLDSPSNAFELAFSLVEDAEAPLADAVPGSNLTEQDPRLGPLTLNGGSTQTHALAPDSPAIDMGSATGTDQRGSPRPIDFLGAPNSTAPDANAADIGAFEFRPPSCRGRAASAVAVGGVTRGTVAADVIVGTPGRDVIRALGGNDLVCALGANDRILGGRGRDRLLGEGGGDLLRGGPGRDRLVGGRGRDRLLGGPGRDRLRGGPGRDRRRQ